MTHQGVTPTRAQCANYAWDMLSLAQNIVDELEATVTTRPNPLPSLTANLRTMIRERDKWVNELQGLFNGPHNTAKGRTLRLSPL